jgi:VWFA-related protein
MFLALHQSLLEPQLGRTCVTLRPGAQSTGPMSSRWRFCGLIFLLLCTAVSAQIISSTTRGDPEFSIGSAAADETTYRLWQVGEGTYGPHSPLESPNGSVSALDLKAPGKARREYEKGYQLLQRKDLPGAVDHLTLAVSIYPNFVAAHSALGSAHLGLNQNDRAHAEFTKAVELDNHLPASYLNLACAELALKDYQAAEVSIQKASALAPLDLVVLTALAYGELMNKDYDAAIVTTQKVHSQKHAGFVKVHLYAAAAWQAQHNRPAAQRELETFLKEEPKSAAAARVTEMLRQLREAPDSQPASTQQLNVTYASSATGDISAANQGPDAGQRLVQALKENTEIAEATEAENTHEEGLAAGSTSLIRGAHLPRVLPKNAGNISPEMTFRTSTNEVAVFFTATDHRKSVTDLTTSDITIRDNSETPAAIVGFRNESQLPLRLGIVIDTSSSVTDRFKFEQESAIEFLKKVLIRPNDLGFVIGVANSVLLVQDFTNNRDLLSRAVNQLAPSGGTALWDAVAFGADKLASRPEPHPVARLLVVLSDGQNNSSSTTLKQVISQAQREEVFIYSVSTTDVGEASDLISSVGTRALQTLAELTGGAAFEPGSLHRLNVSLADLQQLIRGRYLISYKPAHFQGNGQYRRIEITARKGGQKLRVYARKGYFASAGYAETPQ